LQSAVVSSLLSQQLEQKQIEGEWNASMFTLYHAQGATITANEKLEQDNKDLKQKTEIKNAAVNNNNECVNLLSSSTQAQQYLKQSVTNTAVSAANVQIAANAIVKLAGDMGNVYSIVQAADYDSEIYKQAEDARTLMNLTAYEAEQASQMAMESSILTSEVSSAAVLDKCKNNNNLMSGLLKILVTDFNAASENVRADSEKIAAASAAEKAAEGDYKDIDIDYRASVSAYNSMNKGLNINLAVSKKTNQSFDVSFDLIRVPFPKDKFVLQAEEDVEGERNLFPVESYYAIVVKQSEQYTFTVTDAESIVLGHPNQCTKIDVTKITESQSGGASNASKKAAVHHRKAKPRALKSKSRTNRDATKTSHAHHYSVQQTIPLSHIASKAPVVIEHLCDSDDDHVQLGVNYVVFIYARYQESYKRLINNFENFLSAPSMPFYLSNQLKEAYEITWTPDTAISKSDDDKSKTSKHAGKTSEESGRDAKQDHTPYTFTFKVDDDPDFEVEYRLMFLPKDGNIVNANMLTMDSMDSLASEIKTLEQIATEYDLQIEKAQKQLAEYTVQMNNFPGKCINQYGQLLEEITQGKSPEEFLRKQLVSKISEIDKKDADKNISINEEKLGDIYHNTVGKKLSSSDLAMLTGYVTVALQAYITKQSITLLEKDRDDLIVKDEVLIKSAGFIFNPTLAQQVSAGNYIQILPTGKQPYKVTLGAGTTDNFGNLLIDKNSYYPVILSTPGINVDNPLLYTSSLSKVNYDKAFEFIDPDMDHNPHKK
jgi:hypothetical protein